MERVYHTIEPVWDENSRVLILGSIPSPKSREAGFYYAHPQNRFWRVIAEVLGAPTPDGTKARREFALRHNIALGDVIASCEIRGAADSTIKNPVANDIAALVRNTKISHIFTTGATAYKLYQKHISDSVQLPVTPLPSTSAANAAMSIDKLLEAYRAVYHALREA